MTAHKQVDPRTRILAVADRLFYAEGVRATGTEMIMSVAEVAKATFYHHFKSKDALVLSYLANRDQALWDYLADPTPPKNLREALIKFEQYDGASIILVASAGKNKGLPGRSTYSATKAALRSFARTWTANSRIGRSGPTC